jgi:RND family efflux transporter MFP subunit
MRKVILLAVVLAVVAGGAWYYYSGRDSAAAATGQPGGGGAGAGRGGGGMGRGARTPMTVDMAPASRHDLTEYITVVGNLIGAATVDIVPRVAGRIEAINVQLGDRVSKGQQIVKIEDRTIREQIRQAEASLETNKATVISRQNDEKVAASVLARMKAQDLAGLVSKQALEDAESRYNAAVSQVTVAQSQQVQTQARIEELKITLNDTSVISPVNGFVSRRLLDQGAFAGANTVMLSVVDISTVRMVASLVEKGFKRVTPGVGAEVEVDAFPGEQFRGVVSRVAPVFDPATRTAQMEIEVPNPGYRLKPGMYARVRLTVEQRPNALTVPRPAVIDTEGKRGVFLVDEGQTAHFREIRTGLQDGDRVEVLEGLTEGERVVTTGALALRDGDRVALAGQGQRQGGAPGRGRRGG